MNTLPDALPLSNLERGRQIRIAQLEDIPGIMFILENNLIEHKQLTPKNLEQTGFLINGFTSDEAKAAILDTDNFIYLVSIEHNDVVGYTIACDIKKLKSTFQEALALVSFNLSDIIYSNKTLYLRHIAKQTNKKGVGQELLQALMKHAKTLGNEYIICQIAEKPIQNKRSKAFHEKFGFICVGYNQNGEEIAGVYLLNLID